MLAIRREAVVVIAILALTACGSSDGTGLKSGPAACDSPVSVGLDQVVTLAPGVTHCAIAGGSSHQEYVLVPFYGSQVNTQSTVLTITGTNLDVLAAPPTASLTPTANRLPSADVPAGDGPLEPNRGFDLQLRQLERRALAPRVAAARQVVLAPHPAFSAVPATAQVGDTVSLNTSLSPCDSPRVHKAVVTAITNKAIVVADVLNPPGGYTNADYQSIGTTFDTLVDPLDQQNFGAPTDIDSNGRIILFFTETVNELTPRTSQSYVGGFFFSRDLLPLSGSTTLYNCPTSNYAEMFYLLVPDPNGVVGKTFQKDFVAQNTISTTGHEFQHLINASRRFYVNTSAEPFEEVWLNEGLSHIAEELLYYRESGFAPRQDIDINKFFASAQADSAQKYQLNNLARYEELLRNVGAYGPYSGNDSLATRGATWAMLRYLADHHGTGDGTQWQQLVNSTTTGLANLKNVYGTDVMNQIRDWSTSVYTDDLPNVGSEWQQPSWNLRSMMHHLTNTNNTYPLKMEALAPASPLTVSLVASGSAYVQFATAPGKDGTLQFSVGAGQALPPELQFSVIRIQ